MTGSDNTNTIVLWMGRCVCVGYGWLWSLISDQVTSVEILQQVQWPNRSSFDLFFQQLDKRRIYIEYCV